MLPLQRLTLEHRSKLSTARAQESKRSHDTKKAASRRRQATPGTSSHEPASYKHPDVQEQACGAATIKTKTAHACPAVREVRKMIHLLTQYIAAQDGYKQ